jgi:RsiW-degrading membrane proteinase PrsW (M82 family)
MSVFNLTLSLSNLVLILVIPALLLLGYGQIKTGQHLSHEGLWAGFVGGLLVGIALIAWEMVITRVLPLNRLSPLGHAAGQAFLIAAIPEELGKFLALLLVIRQFVTTGDVGGTILAALGVALGFALTENALYVILASSISMIGGGMIGLMRSITAVPEHAIFGLTMGALIAGTSGGGHGDVPGNSWRLAPALIVPIVMHGTYDFLHMAQARSPTAAWTIQSVPLVMAVSVLSAILLCNHVLRRAARSEWIPPPTAAAPAILGCFFVVIGLLMVGFMLVVSALPIKQALAAFCVMPLMLGLDLMWTAHNRM